MATDVNGHPVDSIGDAAGIVWHYLNEHGPVTLSKLARDIDVPRDLAMQGIGWLVGQLT